MDRQPDLLSPSHSAPDPAGRGSRPGAPPSMLVRVEALVRILVRVYLGLLVMVLPWLTLWTQNNLFTYNPLLMRIAENGFVRGMVSGLGLLNTGIALAQLRHLRLFR